MALPDTVELLEHLVMMVPQANWVPRASRVLADHKVSRGQLAHPVLRDFRERPVAVAQRVLRVRQENKVPSARTALLAPWD